MKISIANRSGFLLILFLLISMASFASYGQVTGLPIDMDPTNLRTFALPRYPTPIPPSNNYPGNWQYQAADDLFNEGLQAFNQGNYYSAIQPFLDLLSRYPYNSRSAEACFLLAESYKKTQNYYKALEYYRKVTYSYSNFFKIDRAHYFIGFCLVKQNDLYTAANELKQFVQRFTTSDLIDDAWYVLGKTYERINQYNDAINCYRQIVYGFSHSSFYQDSKMRLEYLENGNTPTYPPVTTPTPPEYPGYGNTLTDLELYQRAHTKMSQGQFNNAITYFSELRKRYPNSAYADDALLYTAQIYFDTRNYLEAIKNYESLMRSYPYADIFSDALYGLASAEFKKAKENASYRYFFERSAANYIKFQEQYPRHRFASEALFKAGECYEHQGYYQNAKFYYQRVLDIYPYSATAQKAREKLQGIY